MNVQWEALHILRSKFGDLALNSTDPTTGQRFQILPSGYKIVPSLRVTQDNISQRDGSVLHPRWTTGLVATITVVLYVQPSHDADDIAYENACDEDLTEMTDQIARWLNGIRDLTFADNQRLFYYPAGVTDGRMLIDLELLSWPDPTIDEDGTVEIQFSVETPYPYAVDVVQTETDISDGANATLVNDGNADTFPVIKVFGPCTTFQIDNVATGLSFVYDGSRDGAVGIGGGDYAEINMFRGTIFLNGDSTDLIPGVDPALTDFFPITCDPAGNEIDATGADIAVLWNRAWV